jgi:hypothetical protein
MLADGLILGHVPASLAEKPHRRDVDRLTETRAKEALRSRHFANDWSFMFRRVMWCCSAGSRLEIAADIGTGVCGRCGGIFHEETAASASEIIRHSSSSERAYEQSIPGSDKRCSRRATI